MLRRRRPIALRRLRRTIRPGAVYGRAAEAPQTDADRNGYCTFVASLLRRYPGVVDVVVQLDRTEGSRRLSEVSFRSRQYRAGGRRVTD